MYLNWLGPYFKAYHLLKGGCGGQRGLQVKQLHEKGRQGALFLFDSDMGPGNFRHLFEYICERIQTLGYHRGCADQHQQRQHGHTEHILKQLLKPDPTDCPKSGRCNQRFGLLTVDLVTVDQQPLFIRLASNPVLESCFTPADTFDTLMAAVFEMPPAPPEAAKRISAYQKAF